MKFTDSLVKGLKPKEQHYLVRETAPRGEGGFCLRVFTSGAKTWQMVYTFEGARKWLSLGEYPAVSLSRAREVFREKRKILAEGKDPGAVGRAARRERREAWTVDTLADEFLAKHCQIKKRPRSAREDELNLARDVRPTWGKTKAVDIRRGDVVALLDSIEARGARVQANRTLATIRKMFAWALEREVVPLNPATGISKPATEAPRQRALSLEEIKTIWKTMDDTANVPEGVKLALRLVLLTGARPGEILAATWEQKDGDWLELPGTATKNKKAHRVFLSQAAQELIGEDGEGLLVGEQIAVYSLSTWPRRYNHFGIAPWTPHDLRRTATTHLGKMGVAPHVLDRLLNHEPAGITAKHYNAHSYGPEVARALEKWGAAVEKAVTGCKTTAQVIPLAQQHA